GDEEGLGAAFAAVHADAEVKVRSGAVARGGAVEDVLSDADAVADRDGLGTGVAMAVRVLGAIVAVEDDADSALPAGRRADNDAVGDSEQGRASRDRDVGRGVVVVGLGKPARVLVVPVPFDGQGVVAADGEVPTWASER